MLSIAVSTVAFFVSGYFLKRYFVELDLPAGMTRNVIVFTFALAISYGVAWLVDRLFA